MTKRPAPWRILSINVIMFISCVKHNSDLKSYLVMNVSVPHLLLKGEFFLFLCFVFVNVQCYVVTCNFYSPCEKGSSVVRSRH